MSDQKTYNIFQGDVVIDRNKLENLSMAIDSGYSDQTIMDLAKDLREDINNAERKLKDVI